MSLSLEFYAGEAHVIGNAFTEIAFDGLRDGTKARAYADLSLHLVPEDLDILCDVVASHLKTESILLNGSLLEEVGTIDDGETGGANIVAQPWVEMIALVDEMDTEILAFAWMNEVVIAHEMTLKFTDHPTRALLSLIRLCKTAINQSLDVVYVWYL